MAGTTTFITTPLNMNFVIFNSYSLSYWIMKQRAPDQVANEVIPAFHRTLEKTALPRFNYIDYLQNYNFLKLNDLHTLSHSIWKVSKSWVSLPDAPAGRICTFLSLGFYHGSVSNNAVLLFFY